MADKVVFLAGLPRSGTTLLANILNQNPRFFVTATSPLQDVVRGMKNAFYSSHLRVSSPEHTNTRSHFRSSVSGAIHGWFPGDVDVGIDKSREWMSDRALLSRIYGDALRIIVPVRDLRGCVVSQEKLFQQSPEVPWGENMISLQDRVAHWLNSNPLGRSGALIRESLSEGYHKTGQMIFVRFEDLASNPEHIMHALYRAIDEDEFGHDFDNIEQTVYEHDAIHWPLGEHTLTSYNLKSPSEDWDDWLGSGVSNEIVKNNHWFYQSFYPERIM